MKTRTLFIVTLATALLTGCATPLNKPIIIAPQSLDEQKELLSLKTINVVDERAVKSLALVNGKPLPKNSLLVPSLTDWFEASTVTNPYGSKALTVTLLNYASFVKQESMSFTIESVLEWRITLEEKNKTWSKSYQTSMAEQGPLQADNAIIEKHLNTLAENLLNVTLNDPEFNNALFK